MLSTEACSTQTRSGFHGCRNTARVHLFLLIRFTRHGLRATNKVVQSVPTMFQAKRVSSVEQAPFNHFMKCKLGKKALFSFGTAFQSGLVTWVHASIWEFVAPGPGLLYRHSKSGQTFLWQNTHSQRLVARITLRISAPGSTFTAFWDTRARTRNSQANVVAGRKGQVCGKQGRRRPPSDANNLAC